MIRRHAGIHAALAALAVLALGAGEARGAAEVRRFNVVLSGIPSSIAAGDFNDKLGQFNLIALESRGLEGLKKIYTVWLFDASGRYFVRPNVALVAGIGQLRQQSKREFLPAINADIQLRAEVLSVPVHVGAAYYLQPYNVGDFRAQAYVGGGFLSGVHNRARIQVVAIGVDSATAAQANFKVEGRGDSPGYYLDAGVHMFFAVRFSVIISALYRSQMVQNMRGTIRLHDGQVVDVGRLADQPLQFPLGGMKEFDLSGVGARLGVAIGF